MSDHHPETHENERDQTAKRDPERPDPPGNPAEHTKPRTPQEADPERVERGNEELDRTIAS